MVKGLNRHAITLFSALISITGLAQEREGPLVLHDSGHTKPLAPFYSHVKWKVEQAPRVSTAIPPHGFRLPISSDLMTPGKVEPRPLLKINENMPRSAMRPLFLFGADETSLKWVRDNHRRFKELRAVGMLIEARTDRQVIAALEAVGDIPMFGGSADEIAQALKLQHYPVLITPQGVSQ